MSQDKDYARFLKKITIVENHWIWTGTLQKGYGRFLVNETNLLAHRYSYSKKYPDIIQGKLLNTCGVKACVNPEHWTNKKSHGFKAEALKCRILALKEQGLEVADIARQLKCSADIVRKRLREQC